MSFTRTTTTIAIDTSAGFSPVGGFAIDCPCTNSTRFLERKSDCFQADGSRGMRFPFGTTCYPLDYGSMECNTHDRLVEPICQGEPPHPQYCFSSWCYVDKEQCMLSDHLVGRSALSFEEELFYSYTTCNDTDTAWETYVTTAALRGKNITVTVPRSYHPHHFKRNPLNFSLVDPSGEEYYNESIPFMGAAIEYFNDIANFASDIEGVDYVYRSMGSDTQYPMSAFSAAARDVQVGISDMGIGPFWVTAERLRMTPFTTPVYIDKTKLLVKRPKKDSSFGYQIEKVLYPFSYDLWWLLVLALLVVSVLTVWFAGPKAENKHPWIAFRNQAWKSGSRAQKCCILYRQVLEALLQNGMFLFGAAVEQEYRATLPHKLLMFGFSILIIVTASAYVANLAAFLTLSGIRDYVDSMEKAIAYGTTICAHQVLREELSNRWPEAKFVFHETVKDYPGVFKSYEEGRCEAVAAGIIDTYYDHTFLEKFCEHDLVFTDALVLDVPIAFPISKNLAAGVSHWLYAGEKQNNIIYEEYYGKYEPMISCSVHIQFEPQSVNDLQALTPQYMVFPFFVLALFGIVAVCIKLCNKKNTEQAAQYIARATNMEDKYATFLADVIQGFHYADIEYSEHPDNSEAGGGRKDEEQHQRDKKKADSFQTILSSSRPFIIETNNSHGSIPTQQHQQQQQQRQQQHEQISQRKPPFLSTTSRTVLSPSHGDDTPSVLYPKDDYVQEVMAKVIKQSVMEIMQESNNDELQPEHSIKSIDGKQSKD